MTRSVGLTLVWMFLTMFLVARKEFWSGRLFLAAWLILNDLFLRTAFGNDC